jgi:hypothetical protein
VIANGKRQVRDQYHRLGQVAQKVEFTIQVALQL